MATQDSKATEPEVTAPEPQRETKQYIEYLGDPDSKYGVDFLSSHTIPRTDHVWEKLGVDKPTKDVVWERDPYGPKIGQPGSRMLLATDKLPAGLAEALAKVPGYKVVNE